MLFKNEITFHNHEKGLEVAKALLDEEYVVMLSYEENLLVINYEWSENGADRNDMVFMRRDEFEEDQCEFREEIRRGFYDELRYYLDRDIPIENILEKELV